LNASSSRRDALAVPSGGAGAGSEPTRPAVLIVDDSRFVRASLVRGLAGRFRIQQADSGERAWELLLLDPTIGAVLSDLSMPGIDGFELLRRVRASLVDRVRELPFAVLSGSDDLAQRERAMSLGADRFVVKGDGVGELAGWLDARLDAAAVADAAPHAEAPVEERAEAPIEAAVASPIAPAVSTQVPAPGEASVPASVMAPAEAPVCAPAPPGPVATPVEPRPGPAASIESPPGEVPGWFASVLARPAPAADAGYVLVRLHAPGLVDLPARLRRGVRSADSLRIESSDTAWLCVPAAPSAALRLGLRFGLLAAGRHAVPDGPGAARATLCLHPVDPVHPQHALIDLMAAPPETPAAGGCVVRVFAGAWGPGWSSTLPWQALRMLVG
jgi:CheY-like chemotaxis protein